MVGDSNFDPYHQWLGIPPGEHPINHYRLLGLALFEENGNVIAHAADRQMSHLKSFSVGPHASDSQRLLNELAKVRLCLLTADAKTAYDQKLRATLAPGTSRAAYPLNPTKRVARGQHPAKNLLTAKKRHKVQTLQQDNRVSPSAKGNYTMSQISAESAFSSVEFSENPEPRVPCVIMVDISTSMHGSKIDELNAGLQAYREELLRDPLASKRVEIALLTFGGDVRRVVEFVTAENFNPPKLAVRGGTPMGEAIRVALDMIEERKNVYRDNGIAYYRPWVFMITDGEPNDHWKPVVSRVHKGEKQKAFSFFAVAVEDANMEILSEICVRKPLWLQGLKFRELFTWLSNSQQAVSRSSPGEEVPLEDPTSGPKGWAEV